MSGTSEPQKAITDNVVDAKAGAGANVGATDPTALDRPMAMKASLKDRIADLNIGKRAGLVGERIAERVKAVQASAPAPAELRERLKAAAAAVRQGVINREALKAGRDGLAAKVEALIKPRAIEAKQADGDVNPDIARLPAGTIVGEEPKTHSRRDIGALRQRLDVALKAKPPGSLATVDEIATAAPPPADIPFETPTTVRRAEPVVAESTGVAARIRDGLTSVVSRRPSGGAGAVAVEPPLPGGDIAIATDEVVTERTRAALAAADRRPIFSVGLLLTALTAGGVLHILTAFAIPAINSGSAFDRLRWQLEPNVMRVFPADPTGQTPLPFLTADVRYAMCRYDITSNSVHVNVTLPDVGWSLALYTPQGDNFYAVPGLDGRVVSSEFTINSASDRLLLPMPGVRRSDTDAAQVTSPQRQGLIVVRAPNLGPAYQAGIDEALKRAQCSVAQRG